MILAVATLMVHSIAVPQAVTLGVRDLSATTAGAEIQMAAAADPLLDDLDVEATDFPEGTSFEPGRTRRRPMRSPLNAQADEALLHGSSSELEPADLRRQEERRKHEWLALAIAGHSAAAFDAWTTRRALSSGKAYEANPFMRPFAGNGSIYAAIQVSPLVLDYVSRRMMHSEHRWMRRTWWVPSVVGTALSVASGVNNLALASR